MGSVGGVESPTYELSPGPFYFIKDRRNNLVGYLMGILPYTDSELFETNEKILQAWQNSSSVYIQHLSATAQRAWQNVQSAIVVTPIAEATEEIQKQSEKVVANFIEILKAQLENVNEEGTREELNQYASLEEKVAYCGSILTKLQYKELGVGENSTIEQVNLYAQKDSKPVVELETATDLCKAYNWEITNYKTAMIPTITLEQYRKDLDTLRQEVDAFKKGIFVTQGDVNIQLMTISEDRSLIMARKISQKLGGEDKMTCVRLWIHKYLCDTNWILGLFKKWRTSPEERKFIVVERVYLRDLIDNLKNLKWKIEQV